MVASGVHGDGGVHSQKEVLLVDAGEDETGLVQGLRPFGRGADIHGRERMPDASEEGRFFKQGARVTHHRKGVHQEAIVVVEAEGIELDQTSAIGWDSEMLSEWKGG